METNSQTLVVNTTNTADVPNGFALISANLRETKGNAIPAERKHRSVVIPEFVLPESVPSQFSTVLLDKFYGLAKDYLETVMEETDRMAREIPVSAFSIDSLLSFFGRQSLSSAIDADKVLAWFDASATGAYVREKCGTDVAKVTKYRGLFGKTAAKNHGINPNTCTVLLALMQPEDLESKMAEYLVNKWQATIEKSQKSEVDAL